jgi:hypothetical protein
MGYKILDRKYNELLYCNDIENIFIKHNASARKPLNAHNYILGTRKRVSDCLEYFWPYAEETPFYDTLMRRLIIDLIKKSLGRCTMLCILSLLGIILIKKLYSIKGKNTEVKRV